MLIDSLCCILIISCLVVNSKWRSFLKNSFPYQGSTPLKSSRSGPKFKRQSIHCILGPHPPPRSPSLPQPWAHQPPKERKTLPKSTVFPWLGITHFKSSRNGPKFDRQSNHRAASWGLIHVPGGHLPQLRPQGPPSDPQKDGKHHPNQPFSPCKVLADKVKS